MAWDAQGRPIVAYRERSGSSSDLMFAEPQPPGTYGWAKTEVGDGYYVPASAAIGAADNGDIFIAYSVQIEKELIVATRHNDIWTSQTVDVGTSTPGALSMAIDSHGRPNVAYRLDGEVRFARFDGDAWDIHVVDTGGSYTGDQALALGSDDLPWISFVRYEDTFVRPVIVAHAVPEPASIGVLVLAGLAMIRRNR